MEIENLAHRACRLYQQQGSPEAGASALDKAAKMLENAQPELALNLYKHAMEVVCVIFFFLLKLVLNLRFSLFYQCVRQAYSYALVKNTNFR